MEGTVSDRSLARAHRARAGSGRQSGSTDRLRCYTLSPGVPGRLPDRVVGPRSRHDRMGAPVAGRLQRPWALACVLVVVGCCWYSAAHASPDASVSPDAAACVDLRLRPGKHRLLRSAGRAAAQDVGDVVLREVAIDGASADFTFDPAPPTAESLGVASSDSVTRYRLDRGTGPPPWLLQRLSPCPGPAGVPMACAGPHIASLDSRLMARLRERGSSLRWTCPPPEALAVFHPTAPAAPEPERPTAATAPSPEQPHKRRALPETEHSADRLMLAGLLATLFIVVPLFFGWGLGLAASSAPIMRRRAPRALVWLLPVLGAAALFRLPPFGLWEASLAGVFCALGLRSGLRGVRWRQLPISFACWAIPLLATALLLEVAVRLVLPSPPDVGGLYQSGFFGPVRGWQCAAIYKTTPEQLISDASELPTIMHVGDSMVAGAFVDHSATFVRELDRRARAAPGGPRMTHLAVSASGASLDTEVLMALHTLDAIPTPRLVVLYFNHNDFHEIDEPVACCDYGPLFAYTDQGAHPRCAARSSYFSPAGKAELSRPPLVLRLLARWSAAAAYLSKLLVAIPGAPRIWPLETTIARGALHYAEVLRYFRDALRARGIELVVVLLPHRDAIGDGPHDAAFFPAELIVQNHERAAAIVKSLDIPHFDAWPYFDALVRAQGDSAWFVNDPPGDVHFNAKGHAALAGWLETSLEPWLAALSEAGSTRAEGPDRLVDQ